MALQISRDMDACIRPAMGLDWRCIHQQGSSFFSVRRTQFFFSGPWNDCFLLTIKFQGVSVKKSFVIRIDNDTYKALEKWASDEFRSVNGQIEFLLDKALKE